MTKSIRVATYNCHLFLKTILEHDPNLMHRDECRKEAIKDFFLRENRHDIVVLCEVWSNKVKCEIAQDLGESLAQHYWFPSAPESLGDGLLVMSRYPLAESSLTKYRNLDGWDRFSQKGIIKTVAETPWGKFRLLATHNQADDDKSVIRKDNFRQLRDEIHRFHPELPALILGDLNVPGQGRPGEGGEYDSMMDLLSGLSDGYRLLHPYPDAGYTYDADKNPLVRRFDHQAHSGRYDYVLFSAEAFALRSCLPCYDIQLRDGTPCSDHYPLFAELELLA